MDMGVGMNYDPWNPYGQQNPPLGETGAYDMGQFSPSDVGLDYNPALPIPSEYLAGDVPQYSPEYLSGSGGALPQLFGSPTSQTLSPIQGQLPTNYQQPAPNLYGDWGFLGSRG